MKRLLTILSLLFIVNLSFGQVKVGSAGNIIATGSYPVVNSGAVKGGLHLFHTLIERNALPANFRDTGMLAYVIDSAKFFYLNNSILNSAWTVWSGSGGGSGGGGCDTCIARFDVSSDSAYGYFIRQNGDTAQTLQIVGDGTGTGGSLIPNGLTIPGIVTWSGTGLIMDIANPQYYFNQKFFSPASIQITLTTADATYGRFDVIYVDSAGNIGSIAGVPASAPIIPQVNPQSQILLSSIYVAANATTPTQINQTLIYDENTEWGTSYTGTGVVDFNDVSNPYHGTKDIKVTSSGNGMALVFTSPTTDTSSISDVLKFFLYAPNDIPGGYSIQFFIGSQAASTALLIASNSYGFSNTHLGAYQNISIPLAAFTFLSPYYNSIRITTLAANTNPVYFDYMAIQHGNYNFAPIDYSNKVDSVSRVSGSDYWWAKGIPHFIGAAGSSGGSGNYFDSLRNNSGTLEGRKLSVWVPQFVLPTAGASSWGSISGTLSAQTDLQTALNAKQNTLTLTTTGSSGTATLMGSTLNVPNYAGGGILASDSVIVSTTSQTVFNYSTFPSTSTYISVFRNGCAIDKSYYTYVPSTQTLTFTGGMASGDKVRLHIIK